jgi:hypothetical protein
VSRSAARDGGLSEAVVVCCENCGQQADERFTVVEHWSWWSDGLGELLPFCPECAEHEFGHRLNLMPHP